MDALNELILGAVRDNCSDIHITGGHPVVFRKNGAIDFDKRLKWSHEQVDALIHGLLSLREMETLKSRLSVDVARTIQHVRVRLNVFNTTRGLSLALRLLPGRPPELNRLNLHPLVQDFCRLLNGLVLVCGPTGCGKSTTIAAMLEEINRTRPAHLVTLEDPVEYRFLSRKAFIEQRELGTHFPSFEQGLLDVLREAPDVIVVGELREPETIRLTLNAVEAGHLVIASLHASGPEDALYRICNAFPGEAQNLVRQQLASTLAVLMVQKLVHLPQHGFRVPVLAILRGIVAVKTLIRENRLTQIESAMQTGTQEGLYTAEKYLVDYIQRQPRFHPPVDIFRPSTEATSEKLYRSQLVPDEPRRRAEDRLRAPIPAAVAEIAAAERCFGRRHYDGPPHYDITEEASMQELIEELQQKKRLKPTVE
jgi:twitching motility protein PilT